MGIDTINNFSHNFILFLIKAFSFKDRKKKKRRGKRNRYEKYRKFFLHIFIYRIIQQQVIYFNTKIFPSS